MTDDDSDYPTPDHAAPEPDEPDAPRTLDGDPLEPLRHAVRQVNEAVQQVLAAPPRMRMPLLPRLQVAPAAEPEEPQEPDRRHLTVAVRTVPVLGEPSEVHTYRDAAGLSWQTYSRHDDDSKDRYLEIQNADYLTVASYPPGTWLHVHYIGYLDATETTDGLR